MKTLYLVDDYLLEKRVIVKKNTYLLNWNRYEKKNFKSIIRYIEKNSSFFKKKFIKFIANIKNNKFYNKSLYNHYKLDKNFSLWEMSLFEEKNIYKNPEINEILKILALEEIIRKKKIKKIFISSNNLRLKKNIQSLIKNTYVEFQPTNEKKIEDKTFLRKNFFYYLYFIVAYFLRRYSFKKKIYKFKQKAILVVDYFSYFDENKAYKGTYDSVFWKKLLPLLKVKKINLNFLHITMDDKKDKFNKNYKILDNLNNKKYISHNILDCQINLKVFLNVFVNWFFNYLKYLLFRVKYSNSFIFNNELLKNIFLDSFVGIWSIKNLYFHFLFDNFFKSLKVKTNVCIYVNEFQGWEKSFIYNFRKHENFNHNIFGIQFNPIRDWDLRYSFKGYSENFNLFPNNIITFYQSSRNKLKKNFLNLQKLKIYICKNLRPLSINYDKLGTLKKNKILVVGDHDDDSTNNLLHFVNKLNYLNKTNIFEYKPHPASNIDIYKFENLKNLKVYLNNDCFKKRYSSYLVSNKTTLGLDLVNKNLKTAILLDNNALNFSPVNKNYKFFIKNVKEYEKFINSKKKNKKLNKNNNNLPWSLIIEIWKKYLNK